MKAHKDDIISTARQNTEVSLFFFYRASVAASLGYGMQRADTHVPQSLVEGDRAPLELRGGVSHFAHEMRNSPLQTAFSAEGVQREATLCHSVQHIVLDDHRPPISRSMPFDIFRMTSGACLAYARSALAPNLKLIVPPLI